MPLPARCPICDKSYREGQFCPEHGARLAQARSVGDIIGGRYRILAKVGQGASGEVFHAEHIYIHKRVALKVLRSKLLDDQEAVERMHREARATSSLGHPNIVAVEDFGRTDECVFLAMEWLEGQTLAELFKQEQVTRELALRAARDTCAGLSVAHAAGIVHRDLKPANLFWAQVGDQRMVKILDFGIAKIAGPSLTETGTYVGTPYYMAPEQALAEDIDGRADIYAVGVILYQMTTGHVPFTADNSLGVLHQHTRSIPVPPSARAPEREIPAELDTVILRCMEKEPSARFQSAEELCVTLNELVGAPPRYRLDVSHNPPLAGMQAKGEAGRRRLLWGAFVALALVSLGVAAVLGLLGSTSDSDRVMDAKNALTEDAALSVDARPVRDAGFEPHPDDWYVTSSSRSGSFAFTATIRPKQPRPVEPFTLFMHLEGIDDELDLAIANGAVTAKLAFVFEPSREAVVLSNHALDDEGEFMTSVTLPKPGKYLVRMSLHEQARRFDAVQFEISLD